MSWPVTSTCAIAGNCTELAARLAALAGERTRAAWIRRHLVRVVARLGDPVALESLRALLSLGAGEDPDCELAGTLVDDNRVPLNDRSVLAIRQQLKSIHAKMEARGMPAGSERALRLFS